MSSDPVQERVSSRPVRGKLLIDGVNGSVVTFPLITAEILIGRLDSVDLVLEDPAVSRIHAKIVREEGRDIIVDLESSSGTLVNGEEIGRHMLEDGDLVEIGSAKLQYKTV